MAWSALCAIFRYMHNAYVCVRAPARARTHDMLYRTLLSPCGRRGLLSTCCISAAAHKGNGIELCVGGETRRWTKSLRLYIGLRNKWRG